MSLCRICGKAIIYSKYEHGSTHVCEKCGDVYAAMEWKVPPGVEVDHAEITLEDYVQIELIKQEYNRGWMSRNEAQKALSSVVKTINRHPQERADAERWRKELTEQPPLF